MFRVPRPAILAQGTPAVMSYLRDRIPHWECWALSYICPLYYAVCSSTLYSSIIAFHPSKNKTVINWMPSSSCSFTLSIVLIDQAGGKGQSLFSRSFRHVLVWNISLLLLKLPQILRQTWYWYLNRYSITALLMISRVAWPTTDQEAFRNNNLPRQH